MVELRLRLHAVRAGCQPVEHCHALQGLRPAKPGIGHGVEQLRIIASGLLGLGEQGLRLGGLAAGGCLCHQRVDGGALAQRLHRFGALARWNLRQIGQRPLIVIHRRADQRPCVQHGAAGRARWGGCGACHAFVHDIERFLGQVQPQVQPCQAMPHPGIARGQHHGRFEGAQRGTEALRLQVLFGLGDQDVGLRACELCAQCCVAGGGLGQQGQRFA